MVLMVGILTPAQSHTCVCEKEYQKKTDTVENIAVFEENMLRWPRNGKTRWLFPFPVVRVLASRERSSVSIKIPLLILYHNSTHHTSDAEPTLLHPHVSTRSCFYSKTVLFRAMYHNMFVDTKSVSILFYTCPKKTTTCPVFTNPSFWPCFRAYRSHPFLPAQQRSLRTLPHPKAEVKASAVDKFLQPFEIPATASTPSLKSLPTSRKLLQGGTLVLQDFHPAHTSRQHASPATTQTPSLFTMVSRTPSEPVAVGFPSATPSSTPTSATARALLKQRHEADGTTFENRADDAQYVEALLRALRRRAREIAAGRQRLAKIKADHARRAAKLGLSEVELAEIQQAAMKKVAAQDNQEELDRKSTPQALEGCH